jgi:hypothetical protein
MVSSSDSFLAFSASMSAKKSSKAFEFMQTTAGGWFSEIQEVLEYTRDRP